MIRRNAQKGIQIARRGYLSFVEKGNIGVVNYTQTGTIRKTFPSACPDSGLTVVSFQMFDKIFQRKTLHMML